MKITLAALLALLLPTAAALASSASAVPAANSPEMASRPPLPHHFPTPASEMEQLKWFVGTWTCEGEDPQTPLWAAHRTKTTLRIAVDLDGFWLSGSLEEQKTAENPYPTKERLHWTYDDESKSFKALRVDNHGGSATQTAAGWHGDKLLWSGDRMVLGERMPAHDLFTRKADGQVHHLFEAELAGQWMNMAEEDCRKTAPAK